MEQQLVMLKKEERKTKPREKEDLESMYKMYDSRGRKTVPKEVLEKKLKKEGIIVA